MENPQPPATSSPDAPVSATPAVTPMAFARVIVQACRTAGLPADAALQAAGLSATDLAQPLGHITAQQLEQLSAYAMQALDDEALGWFERRLPWGSYGLLARASLGAPDLALALRRWCRHHGLLTDAVQLTLETPAQGPACLRITEQRDLGEAREFALVTLLRNVLGYGSWLIDSRITLTSTALPFARPAHADAYAWLFPGQVTFEAATAAVWFDPAYLALPVQRQESDLRLMLPRALRLIVLPYRRDRLLAQRARDAILAHPRRLARLEDLAAHLDVAPRSLQRHLRAEGSSLQDIRDAARREQAIRLLTRSREPVAQIARAVGFRNAKSFSRAFRAWTGVPPSHYRRG